MVEEILNMNHPNKIGLMEFLADLTILDQMMLHIRQEASLAGIEEKAISKIELACEEALVNIISYAYPEKKGKLSIECTKHGQRFEITVKDKGLPFNPIGVEVDSGNK